MLRLDVSLWPTCIAPSMALSGSGEMSIAWVATTAAEKYVADGLVWAQLVKKEGK